MGARTGMVAPDDITYDYLHGRDFAPKGRCGIARSRIVTLPSDPDAEFDRGHTIDMSRWRRGCLGRSPEHVIAVDAMRSTTGPQDKRAAWSGHLRYQGLEPGKPIEGTRVDWVFMARANSRISDLRAAAAVAKGRHRPPTSRPGSCRARAVKRRPRRGLDRCSARPVSNGASPAARCHRLQRRAGAAGGGVSTSNPQFRRPPRGLALLHHLASPAMAAAAAIKNAIADVRKI
jgi:3-isopropylmalate/(R)-2-methylmalate dehydratase large subunit